MKVIKTVELELEVLCDCGETFTAGLKRGTICPKCNTDITIAIGIRKPDGVKT